MSTERDEQDFTFYQGDYQELSITVYSNNTTSIKNLTGASIKWALSKNVDTTGIIVVSTTSTGDSKISITGATAGQFTVFLASSETTGLSGKFFHSARVIDASTYPGKYRDWETDRKSTRLNSSHRSLSRMPSSA